MTLATNLRNCGEIHIKPISCFKRLSADKEFSSMSGRHYNAFIFYIDGGHRFFSENKCIFAPKDTFVFLPKGFKYRNQTISDTCVYYQIDFEYYIDGKENSPFDTAFSLNGAIAKKLHRLCSEATEKSAPGKPYGRLDAASTIIEILHLALCEIDDTTKGNITERCLLSLRKFYDSDMTISEMAKASFTSVSTFEHCIKTICNETPTVYRNRLRTERALELLKEKSLPISEIAKTVGYSDIFYFSKIFKKFIGISPTCARKKF